MGLLIRLKPLLFKFTTELATGHSAGVLLQKLYHPELSVIWLAWHVPDSPATQRNGTSKTPKKLGEIRWGESRDTS
jgi:hypothetical protein